MSRCAACDRNLNDYETTRKIVRKDGSVEYPDLCNKCFRFSELSQIVHVEERADLAETEEVEAEEGDLEEGE